MSEDFDKYLAIANQDIQAAKNMGELKSYVASILWDNDKKVELLQQKENIIKEVRGKVKELANLYDDNYTVSDKAKDILEILEGGK